MGIDVPGRLKIDDFPIYDTAYTLHIGNDRSMAARADLAFVDTDFLLVSPASQNVLRADAWAAKNAPFQLHVGPDRAWAKTLQVVDSLIAPEVTTLQADVDAAELEIVGLQAIATTLEADASLQGQKIGTCRRTWPC